jgi:hypothetical protein
LLHYDTTDTVDSSLPCSQYIEEKKTGQTRNNY